MISPELSASASVEQVQCVYRSDLGVSNTVHENVVKCSDSEIIHQDVHSSGQCSISDSVYPNNVDHL